MIKVYLSHRISGGDEATPVANMEINCIAAQSIGREVSRELNRFMPAEVYIPGGPTEQFVRRAWLKKMLTVPQIMEIDCDIIADSNFLLCYVPDGDTLQGGRLEEVRYAKAHGVPVRVFSDAARAVESIRVFYSAHKKIDQEVTL